MGISKEHKFITGVSPTGPEFDDPICLYCGELPNKEEECYPHQDDVEIKPPLPVSIPSGEILAFACARCWHLQSSNFQRHRYSWRHNWWMAARCCTCRTCGKLTGPYASLSCPECEKESREKWEAASRIKEAAARLALNLAKDEDAATSLQDLMRDISEDCWAAGWLDQLEYILWRRLETEEITPNRPILSREEISNLRALSEQAGGWWHWPSDNSGEMFIPMDEWKAKYNEWKATYNASIDFPERDLED